MEGGAGQEAPEEGGVGQEEGGQQIEGAGARRDVKVGRGVGVGGVGVGVGEKGV